jgi:hypothetical protein
MKRLEDSKTMVLFENEGTLNVIILKQLEYFVIFVQLTQRQVNIKSTILHKSDFITYKNMLPCVYTIGK